MPSRVGAPWLLAVSIVSIGLILRGPLVAVAPVVEEIQADLSMTAAQAGLLTSVPVLCFALITPLASLLIARVGPDLATTAAISGVLLGTILRSSGGVEAVFAGTVLLGASITVGNVVLPVIIRRDVPPGRIRGATALFTSAFNLAAVIATIGTAPIALAAGWRVSLLWWAGLAAVVLAAWLSWTGRRGLAVAGLARAVTPPDRAARRIVRAAARETRRWDRTTAALLAIGFVAQTFAYYGMTAWLPTLLGDELGFDPAAAGSAASVFQFAGLVGAVAVPLIARRGGLLAVTVGMTILWPIVPLGLLLAPAGWPVWSILGGLAQGAAITLVFILVVEIARDDAHARRLSTVTQGFGYAFGGAIAPTLLGGVHDATSGWSVPLLLLAAAVLTSGGMLCWTVTRSRRQRASVPGS